MLIHSTHPGLRRTAFILVTLLIFIPVTACSSGDSYRQISPPISSSELEGKDYKDIVTRFESAGFTNVKTEAITDLVLGWLTSDGEVEDVLIAGDSDFTKDDKFDPGTPVIVRYHTFPSGESTPSEAAGAPAPQPTSPSNTQASVAPTPKDEPSTPTPAQTPENLTAENNPDLTNLLSLKNPDDPSVSAFANNHKGQIIEFDGCVVDVAPYGSTRTRFTYLLSAGDFDPDSALGPNFQFSDIGYYDFHFPADNAPESVLVGMNLHIVAEVGEYDSNTSLFQLRPVETSVR